MKLTKILFALIICISCLSCNYSTREKSSADKTDKNSASNPVPVDTRVANTYPEITNQDVTSENSNSGTTNVQPKMDPAKYKKAYGKMLDSAIPELDDIFKFQNANDRNEAVNNTLKVVTLQDAIAKGYHVSPMFLGVSKYTCKRCYHLVSNNLFKGNPKLFSLVGFVYEECPSRNIPVYGN